MLQRLANNLAVINEILITFIIIMLHVLFDPYAFEFHAIGQL